MAGSSCCRRSSRSGDPRGHPVIDGAGMSHTEILLAAADHEPAPVESRSLAGFQLALACTTSPVRAGCEDAGLISSGRPGELIGCALDGMGGMASGLEASRLAVGAASRRLTGADRGPDPLAATVAALRDAHAAILQGCPGGGVTAAAAVLEGEHVRALHAGDAEVLVLTPEGELRYRSVPHSPVGRAVQRGLLSEEAALHHPERHLVHNGLGVRRMSLHLGPRLPLAPGDTVVLATDGVTDNARSSEIAECLRRGDLARGASQLVELCRERMAGSAQRPREAERLGKPDDLTLIAIRRDPGSAASVER